MSTTPVFLRVTPCSVGTHCSTDWDEIYLNSQLFYADAHRPERHGGPVFTTALLPLLHLPPSLLAYLQEEGKDQEEFTALLKLSLTQLYWSNAEQGSKVIELNHAELINMLFFHLSMSYTAAKRAITNLTKLAESKGISQPEIQRAQIT